MPRARLNLTKWVRGGGLARRINFADPDSGIGFYMYRVCPLHVPSRSCDGDQCALEPPSSSLACNDGDPCTLSGSLRGECNDGDPCTVRSVCTDGSACTPGAACDDGGPCTVESACHDGGPCTTTDTVPTCTVPCDGEELPSCDELAPCTVDTCTLAAAPRPTGGLASVSAVGTHTLRHGGMYYIEAWAANGVGTTASARSPGWTVDLTPPEVADVASARVVDTLFGNPVTFRRRWDVAGASWEGVFRDQESGIVDYRMCVGFGPGQADILPCTSVGPVTSAELVMPSGTPVVAERGGKEFYFTTIVAVNGANATAEAVSAGVRVDATPPSGGVVQDGDGEGDAAYSNSAHALSATWAGFRDNETEIVRYWVHWGTTPLGLDFEPVDAGLESELATTGLFLTHGATYYATVTAVNQGGGETAVSSDGVTVSLHGPSAAGVEVVVGNEPTTAVYHTNLDHVNASWTPFTGTAALPVAGYSVAVCRATVPCRESDFVDVGPTPRFNRGGLGLQDGAQYRVVVRGWDPVRTPSAAGQRHQCAVAYTCFTVVWVSHVRDMSGKVIHRSTVTVVPGRCQPAHRRRGVSWAGPRAPRLAKHA